MPAPSTLQAPEPSAARRYGLLGAAMGAALLGLTLLDVEGASVKRQRTAAERTAECIVASAVFVGVAHAPKR